MSTVSLVLLHTCEVPGVVAAVHAGRLVAQVLGPRGAGGRTVLGAVHEVLQRLGAGLGDMQGVFVTNGPGSFTGIRVGIATAQGLAAARGWRPWVCDALMLEAMACRGAARPLAVCHDARRGEIYARLYDVSGDRPVAVLPAFCAPPAAAAAHLREAAPTGGVLVGSGADVIRTLVPDWPVREPPTAAALAQAAIGLAAPGGAAVVDALRLEPFYLRQPDIGTRRGA